MSLTLRSPVQIGGALLVVALLFGAALAIGKATAPTGTTTAVTPERADASHSATATISGVPAGFKLPPLRHPAPKPAAQPVSSPPVVSAPVTSASVTSTPATPAPAAPAAPSSGS